MADQYVLLPRTGLRAASGPAHDVLTRLPRPAGGSAAEAAILATAGRPPVMVIDTIAENGPKLVELETAVADAINRTDSPVRAVRVVEYARPGPVLVSIATQAVVGAPSPVPVTIRCTDATTSGPIAGVTVVAFTNFLARIGDEGITDAQGEITLHLTGAVIERMYCYAPAGYWGAFRRSLPVQPAIAVDHTPVSLTWVDAVRHYYGATRFVPQTGVKVGVIDTGAGPHRDLNIVGGQNTVTGESATDYADGGEHGTHVSGLIGSNGTPPTGLRGMAPGIPLWIGRVFPKIKGGATNYAILKAMIRAAQEGCDIINLSLGGGPFDEIVQEAIEDARNQGMLVVAAAGNDGRKPVNYPAAYRGATAVSAMGREGTFPPGSVEEADVLRPPQATDPPEFFAEFSNLGPAIKVVGLGVGTLSTLPNQQFGPMSGTSMAAPVVAGAAACLLSGDASVYGMVRDAARSAAIELLLQSSCVRRGFGLTYEGYGLPDPLRV